MTEIPTALSYASGVSTTPLLGETIGDNFDRTVAAHGDRDALVDIPSGQRWTYRALQSDINVLAAALLSRGIGRGDRVGMWSPNCPEWTMIQYATAKIGAILVNINPAYRTHELEYVLNQSGIRMLVATPWFKTSDYGAMIESARPNCTDLTDVLLLGTPEWDAFIEEGKNVDAGAVSLAQRALSADDPINIQYTSGTTGFPKGATLSHHNILNNGFFVGELLRFTEHDKLCIPVPFYHCFGMVMGNLACTTHGATMVLPGASFDPRATLAAVASERCTALYGVPTMFIAELAHPEFDSFDLSSLRTGIMSGSPCPIEYMNQVIERMGMKEVAICYGMTETSPVAVQTRWNDDIDKRVSTVGRVCPHVEIKVVNPANGLTVERGEAGEVCIRGYSVMVGYWNDPEKTAESIDSGRWMHTGDLGTMDADGYLAITGRIKDMVIRGGENIYPREIEEFLYTHPDILDAQVVGVPDPKFGEELMACLVLREGASELTVDTLKEFCAGKLAHYKVPRYVRLMNGFPMTITGKIRKVELRDDAIDYLENQLAVTP